MKHKKNLFWLSIILFVAIFIASPLRAQVTVGDETAPQSFSLLEISTVIKDGGLRLPQLTTVKRDLLNLSSNPAEAKGLVIYNTSYNCIEYWNNAKWISLCSGSASIFITGPSGDPFDPEPNTDPGDDGSSVFPKDGGEKGPFTPGDSPACTAQHPPYQILLITGGEYSKITVLDVSTGKFKLTMDANPTARPRYAIVRVVNNCTGEYRDFLFSQEAQDIGVYPDPTKPNVPAGGDDRGPFMPEVNPETCPSPGTWTVTSDQPLWCTVSYNSTTGEFSLQFLPNPSIYSRSTIITVENSGCGTQAKYTIIQNGNSIGLGSDNTQPPVQAGGGDTDPTTPESNPPCTTATPAYSLSIISGTGYAQLEILNVNAGTFKVWFDLNTSIYERYATVRVKNNCTGAYRDFTYTQEGQNVGIRPDLTQPPVPAPGGQFGPYTPETNPENCPPPVTYEVTVSEDWCTAVTTDPTTGAFYLIFRLNPLSTPRYVDVTIKAMPCDISSTYTVKQLADPCYVRMDIPESITIGGQVWATKNVDAPGTFAVNTSAAGMFYQWNSKVGWSTTTPGEGVSILDWPDPPTVGEEWESANDPCPTGWRIPTYTDIEALLATTYIYIEATKAAELGLGCNAGCIFGTTNADSYNPNNHLFLPAHGCRYNTYYLLPYNIGMLRSVDSGFYWSRLREYTPTSMVRMLVFRADIATLTSHTSGNTKYSALSVRCVQN